MNVLVIDLCYEKDSLHKEEFVKPVETILKILKISHKIIHFKDVISYKKYSHIIFCGVALRDFDYLNHKDKFLWIRNAKCKMLGICAGAQLIASIYGAEIEENIQIGLNKVEITNNNSILDNCSLSEIFSLHKKAFNLPEDFEIILENLSGIQLIHKENRIYCSLFHPEVRNKKLITNFLSL